MDNKQKDLLRRLNRLEDQYQHYVTNTDNIWYWACDQYNTQKPTAKQLESICEYSQNYSDYIKIVNQIGKKQRKLMEELPEAKYDGCSWKVVEVQ